MLCNCRYEMMKHTYMIVSFYKKVICSNKVYILGWHNTNNKNVLTLSH